MKKFITIFVVGFALSLAPADASAQQWQMIASFPGSPANFFSSLHPNGVNFNANSLDFDGDSVTDITFLTVDPNNPNIVYLTIQSGANPNQKWQIPLPNGIIAVLIGFFDFDGTVNQSNLKEIVLARKVGNKFLGPIILDSAGNVVHAYAANVLMVTLGDINRDGLPDIIVADPAAMEVQIWGYK